MHAILAAALGALLAWSASADGAAAALAAAREAYPATDVRAARPTPLPGLYEFDMGGQTVYGDAAARYLILGRMLDLASEGSRLARRVQPAEYRTIRRSAILLQRGGSGEMIVFSDPLCPFCVRLEQQLAAGQMRDYSVYLVLVAFQPGSGKLVAGIMCAPDRAEAYRQATMAGGSPAAGCDPQLMREHDLIARRVGVQATPTLLAPAGYLHAGLLETGELRAWVDRNQHVE